MGKFNIGESSIKMNDQVSKKSAIKKVKPVIKRSNIKLMESKLLNNKCNSAKGLTLRSAKSSKTEDSDTDEWKEINMDEFTVISETTDNMSDDESNCEKANMKPKKVRKKIEWDGPSKPVVNKIKGTTEICGSKLPDDGPFSNVILIGDSYISDLYSSWPKESVIQPYFIWKKMITISEIESIIKHHDFMKQFTKSFIIVCLGITDIIEFTKFKKCTQSHKKISIPTGVKPAAVVKRIRVFNDDIKNLYPGSHFVFAYLPGINFKLNVSDILTNFHRKWRKCNCRFIVPTHSQTKYDTDVNRINQHIFNKKLTQVKGSSHFSFTGSEVVYVESEWKLAGYSKLPLTIQMNNRLSALLLPAVDLLKSEIRLFRNPLILGSLPIYILGDVWLQDVNTSWEYHFSHMRPLFYSCENYNFKALKEFILSTILPEEPCIILTSIGSEYFITYDEHQCEDHPSVKYPIPKTCSMNTLKEEVLEDMNEITSILKSRNKCKLYYMTCYPLSKDKYVDLIKPAKFHGDDVKKCSKYRNISKMVCVKAWQAMKKYTAIVDESFINHNMHVGIHTCDIGLLMRKLCSSKKYEQFQDNKQIVNKILILMKEYLHSLSKLFDERKFSFDKSLKMESASSNRKSLYNVYDDIIITIKNTNPVESGNKRIEDVPTNKVEPISIKKVEPIPVKNVEPISTKKLESISSKKVESISVKKAEPISTKNIELISTKGVEPISTKNVEPISTKKVQPISTKKVKPISTKKVEPTKQSEQISIKKVGPLCIKKVEHISRKNDKKKSTNKKIKNKHIVESQQSVTQTNDYFSAESDTEEFLGFLAEDMCEMNLQVISECTEGEKLLENDNNLSDVSSVCSLEQDKRAESISSDSTLNSAIIMTLDAESISSGDNLINENTNTLDVDDISSDEDAINKKIRISHDDMESISSLASDHHLESDFLTKNTESISSEENINEDTNEVTEPENNKDTNQVNSDGNKLCENDFKAVNDVYNLVQSIQKENNSNMEIESNEEDNLKKYIKIEVDEFISDQILDDKINNELKERISVKIDSNSEEKVELVEREIQEQTIKSEMAIDNNDENLLTKSNSTQVASAIDSIAANIDSTTKFNGKEVSEKNIEGEKSFTNIINKEDSEKNEHEVGIVQRKTESISPGKVSTEICQQDELNTGLTKQDTVQGENVKISTQSQPTPGKKKNEGITRVSNVNSRYGKDKIKMSGIGPPLMPNIPLMPNHPLPMIQNLPIHSMIPQIPAILPPMAENLPMNLPFMVMPDQYLPPPVNLYLPISQEQQWDWPVNSNLPPAYSQFDNRNLQSTQAPPDFILDTTQPPPNIILDATQPPLDEFTEPTLPEESKYPKEDVYEHNYKDIDKKHQSRKSNKVSDKKHQLHRNDKHGEKKRQSHKNDYSGSSSSKESRYPKERVLDKNYKEKSNKRAVVNYRSPPRHRSRKKHTHSRSPDRYSRSKQDVGRYPKKSRNDIERRTSKYKSLSPENYDISRSSKYRSPSPEIYDISRRSGKYRSPSHEKYDISRRSGKYRSQSSENYDISRSGKNRSQSPQNYDISRSGKYRSPSHEKYDISRRSGKYRSQSREKYGDNSRSGKNRSPSHEKYDNISRRSSKFKSPSPEKSRWSVERDAVECLRDVHEKECVMYRNNPEAHPDHGKERRGWFEIMTLQHGYSADSYFLQEKWKSVWIEKMENIFSESWEEKKNKCLSMLPGHKRLRSISPFHDNIPKRHKSRSSPHYSPGPSTYGTSANYPFDSVKELEMRVNDYMQRSSFSVGGNNCQQLDSAYPSMSSGNNYQTRYPFNSSSNEFQQSSFATMNVPNQAVPSEDNRHNQKDLTGILEVTTVLSEISDRFGKLGPFIRSFHEQLIKDNFMKKNLLQVLMDDEALLLLKMISDELSRFLGDGNVSIVQKAIYLEAQEKLGTVLKEINHAKRPFNDSQLESLKHLTKGMDMLQVLKLIKENLKLKEGSAPDDQKVMNVYISLKAVSDEETQKPPSPANIAPSFKQLLSNVSSTIRRQPCQIVSSIYGMGSLKPQSKAEKIKNEFKNMTKVQQLDKFRNFSTLAFEEKNVLLSHLDEIEASNPHFAKVLRMMINDRRS